PVRLKNPLSLETEVMRTSIVPGLLSSLLRNYNRGIRTARLYEMGRVYRPSADPMDSEERFLGIIASGNAQEKTVLGAARPWSFFDLKGDVEVLLETLAVPLRTVVWKSREAGSEVPDYYHPGIAAELIRGDVALGIAGQLHPKICVSYKVK